MNFDPIWIFQYSNYMLELLLSEMVFLFSFPKKKRIVWLLPLSSIVLLMTCFGAYYLFYQIFELKSPWFYLALLFTLISLTVVTMYFCFDVPFIVILAACSGGVALQHINYHIYTIFSQIEAWQQFTPTFVLELIFNIVLDSIAFFTLGQIIKKQKYYKNYNGAIVILSAIIIGICIGLTRVYRRGYYSNIYNITVVSSYAITCCLLCLFMLFFLWKFINLESENKIIKQLQKKEQKDYQLRKENIELLNIKFHDLKHMISHLGDKLTREEIKSLKQTLDVYDGFYKTGLASLDAILNEKVISCLSENITLTYMGSATCLSFVSDSDIYSLFGNILDNAIEAVRPIKDPKKRAISVVVETRGDFIYINAINYTINDIIFVDGLPKTSKTYEEGYHGFGFKSLKRISENYQGGLSARVDKDLFILSCYLLKSE